MKKYLILIFCGTLLSCIKKEEPKISNSFESSPKVVEPTSSDICKETCEAVDIKICNSLFQEYDKCKETKKESTCKEFISAFSIALPKTVKCTNTCSKVPFERSITYGCDEVDKSGYPKITERSAHLLTELKFKAAIDLLLSDEFYSILDGALSEDIYPLIEKARNKK